MSAGRGEAYPIAARSCYKRSVRALEPAQICLDFSVVAPAAGPWRLARTVEESPHRRRILERLDLVRRHFPELDGIQVRVGLARKRGVLGWGSLDPQAPGIWVRPRKLDRFTIAHELTHLLQARGLVPRGERACDLWALARSASVVDAAPNYLRLPRALRAAERLEAPWPELLHQTARRAIEARAAGRRNYLASFEKEIERAWAQRRTTRAVTVLPPDSRRAQ